MAQLLTAIFTAAGLAVLAVFQAWQSARAKQAAQEHSKRLESGNKFFVDQRDKNETHGERIAALEARITILERIVDVDSRWPGPPKRKEEAS